MLTAALILFLFDVFAGVSIPGFVYGTFVILFLLKVLINLWLDQIGVA